MRNYFHSVLEPAAFSSLLLELKETYGLEPEPHYGGQLILKDGEPILRSINLENGQTLVYFFRPFFSNLKEGA